MSRTPFLGLSKSRFCEGLQCERRLWWHVHEPDAPELAVPPSLQAVFATGHRVGELARERFPGGVIVGHDYWETGAKVADTAAALAARAPAIFEAAFQAGGVFVAIDALERCRGGHRLVEVKSTTRVKEQFLPDVAIQVHVARAAGVEVKRAELMHLDPACRYPDLSGLFVREDVTAQVKELLPAIPRQVRRLRAVLDGPLPEVEPGARCTAPYECPFHARCNEAVPRDHVTNLYKGGRAAAALLAEGIEHIRDIPEGFELPAIAARQARAVRARRAVVEPGLGEALRVLVAPVAYLDFETINPAIPVWPGCGPFMAVPVQMSCHVMGRSGGLRHHAFLADGPTDPRPALADAVVEACDGAETVVAYNAPFERRCLEHLAASVPGRRRALLEIARRLVDLLPIVRDHVYHPGFGGGFGMKAVAPALVPGLDYRALEIGEGATASAVLEGLLLGDGALPSGERRRLRARLLAYCELDTLAMVKVAGALERLAS